MSNEIEKKETISQEETQEKHQLSETWAEDCIAELDEWIESQGIYIRQ